MASHGGFRALLAVAVTWWFSIVSTHPAWRVTSRRLRPQWGGSVLAQPSGDWEDQGLPGPPTSARGKQPCQPSPAASWHLAPRQAARAHHRLPSASPRCFSSGPAVTCSLDFSCKQLCQRAPPEACECAHGWVGGWRWGEWGRLPERPTISVWFTLGRWHCGPRGPGWAHFLSVLVTAHMPRLFQVELLSLQVPGLPHEQERQEEERPGTPSLAFLLWGGRVVSHLLPGPSQGASLSLCPHTGGRT